MQIVIDIDDKVYGLLKYFEKSLGLNDKKDCNDDVKTALIRAVINGTPLLKGHGRLIDADEAIKTLKSLGSRDYRREKGTIQEAIKMLSFDEYTPTIIEADKAESEDKE